MRKLGASLAIVFFAGMGCVTDVGGEPAPVAVVGADGNVALETEVTLDGSGSHVPGNPGAVLSYAWSISVEPSPGAGTLGTPAAATTSFLASAPGHYVVRLVVSHEGRDSKPDYGNVRVFELALPPAANAGPDQTVDPGVTVTLDGTGSADPNGGALTYAWTQTTGDPVTLSDPAAAQPTFTSPQPAGTLSFSLVVTDNTALASQPDTVVVTVSDLPPVAVITAPATGDEGAAVALDGTSSYDPNGDPGTAFTYAWTVQSNLGITLTDPAVARPAFTVPSFCGAEQVTVGLTVTVGGQASAPVSAVVDLQDIVNNAPTANAGGTQTVGEGDTVTLDGSGSADCNGDALTYAWTQTSGPAVTLSDTTAAQPTFTAPTVLADTFLGFLITVTDPAGLTDTAAVTVSVRNSVNEPPIANAGPPQSVQVVATVTLDGSGSSDPNGDALTYAWTQLAGTGVTLSDATAVQPTFTAPTTPGDLEFQLVVNDGAADSAPASVTIVVNPAGPDLTASTITTADPSLVADGAATTGVTVSVVDGVGNALIGQAVVIGTTAGTLLGSVVDQGDGTYTQVLRAPTTTGQALLDFTIGGQAASDTATVDFVPGTPSGTIDLFPAPSAIPADGSSTSTITSGTITDDNGNAVADGTLVTVSTDLGTITTVDADAGLPGIQVATSGGVIVFVLRSQVGVGTANLQANSVTGTASGSATVPFQTGLPEGTIAVVVASPIRVADGSSTTQVTGGPVTDASGNTVPDGTLITVTIDGVGAPGTLLDADEDPGTPGLQVSTTGGTFVITVQSGTQAGTLTVNVASAQGSATGSADVTLIPGPAAGTITLTASPDPIAVSGTTSPLPTTTTVTSGVITDLNGNPVPDGTLVTVTADLGSTISTLDADLGQAGIQVATVGGVIAFDIDSGTLAGTLTAGASVDGATGSTTLTVAPGPATSIVYVSGSGQSGTVGSALTGQLVVRTEDANLNPVPGESVAFAATAGGGGVSSPTVTTDAAGEASVTATLGTTAGTDNNTYEATAALSGSPITFTASADPDVAVSLEVTGHPSPSTAGTSQTVTITARDQYGNVATGYTGTVTFTSSDGSAVLPGNTTFTGGDAGVITASVELRTAGSQSVTATDTVTGSITGSQTGITIQAAAADVIVYVSGDGQSGQISSALGQPLVVRVDDAFGNPVAGETVSFAATAGGGGVSPASASTDAAGLAQTTATVGSTVGTDNNTFEATAALTGSPITFTASVTSGPADHLVYVSGDAQTGTVGAALTSELVVRVEDAGNNPVTGYTVAFAATAGGGSVLPTSIATDAAGEARTTATLGTLAGTDNNTYEATAALTGSPITFTASADPDVAVSLEVTGHPSPSTAGTSQTVTITARDQYGNVATGYTGTVTFTSSDGSAVLPGNTTFTGGDAGVITASVELRTAGSQSVTATDTVTGSITGSQTGITVDPGAANKLAMAVEPSNVASGASISPAIEVEVQDQFGNRVTTGSHDVTIAFANDASGGSANLTASSPVATVSGVATFSGVSVDVAASGYTLQFTAPTLTAVVSAAFDVVAGAPASLAFDVQPSNTSASGTITPAVTVRILDANGNLCATATHSVTMAIDNDPNGSSVLSGTLSVSAVSGVATFADLSIDLSGTGFTLLATATGLASATSGAFDIGGCTLAALASASGVGAATTAFPWDTIVLDGTGSTDCGASVTYSWSVAVTATDGTADQVGGFAPWATLPTTGAGGTTIYYVQEPGSYVFTLTMDDAGTPYTSDATITVASFAQIPYGGANEAAADSRSLKFDPVSGRLFIGTEGGGMVYDQVAGTIQNLPCIPGSQVRTLAVSPGGVPHFGHANARTIERVDDVAACIADTGGVTTLDPNGVAASNPARTRDILFPDGSEDFFFATDNDIFFWDDSATSFTEYAYATNGDNAEYRALGRDHDGDYWFASWENANSDRTVKTADPSTETATLDLFTSANDKARCIVRGLLIPSFVNEMWVGTDINGIAYYPDAATASSGGATVFDLASGDLLSNEVWGGVLENGTGDLWFVTNNGIARYKRDVGDFATVAMGGFGLPAFGGGREFQGVAIDEGTARGRILFFSLRSDGIYEIVAP
ncbi:MAG: invasin domain 3-containing protein [Deltaproteobacteria bacterium]|nr:invasin domain 3-containing protein [Deltaproteobacteria bacterium]